MWAALLIYLFVQTGAWTQALFALASGDPSDAEGAARRQSQFKVLCEVSTFHTDNYCSHELTHRSFFLRVPTEVAAIPSSLHTLP